MEESRVQLHYTKKDKWVVSLLAGLLFMLVASPTFLSMTSKVLPLSSSSGHITVFGLLVHGLIFALLVRYMMMWSPFFSSWRKEGGKLLPIFAMILKVVNTGPDVLFSREDVSCSSNQPRLETRARILRVVWDDVKHRFCGRETGARKLGRIGNCPRNPVRLTLEWHSRLHCDTISSTLHKSGQVPEMDKIWTTKNIGNTLVIVVKVGLILPLVKLPTSRWGRISEAQHLYFLKW